LDRQSRKLLLEEFGAKYEIVRGDHVTLDATDDLLLAPKQYPIFVTGHLDCGFMDVLTCEVAGDVFRPDGNRYHVTLSHTPDHRSVEANDVLKAFDVKRLPAIIALNATPFSRRRHGK
jgi:hypothetical protein